MKLAPIISAFLLLNIAVGACTPRITGDPCSAAETQDALQQLLRDELSREVAALGGHPEHIPGFNVPINHIVVVALDTETRRVECGAGIGETGAEIRYTVAPDLSQRGRYVYRLTYIAPTAAWEVLRAVGEAPRAERDAVEAQIGPANSADQALSREILALIERERAANTVCRGSFGEETERACERRTALGEQLNQQGMCYGREGESGYQMQWHRCGAGSYRTTGFGSETDDPTVDDVASAAIGRGELAELIVGSWRIQDEVCDSGAPLRYDADGSLWGEGIRGRWSLDEDVLTETYRILNDAFDEAAGWTNSTATSQLDVIGTDRLLVTPLEERAEPYEILRCS